jgi:hypothetical protein
LGVVAKLVAGSNLAPGTDQFVQSIDRKQLSCFVNLSETSQACHSAVKLDSFLSRFLSSAMLTTRMA